MVVGHDAVVDGAHGEPVALAGLHAERRGRIHSETIGRKSGQGKGKGNRGKQGKGKEKVRQGTEKGKVRLGGGEGNDGEGWET